MKPNVADGAKMVKDGINTGERWKEIAAKILSQHQRNEADHSKAEGKKPAAEGKQPGVVLLSATYTFAIEIGDGPDKRRQHIVQLVNGKEYPDASKDDAVSLNFFTEPPAKLSDQKQMQETIGRLINHLKVVKRQLEDAAAGVPKKSHS